MSGGIALIAVGAVTGVVTVFALWNRLPDAIVLSIVSACGACVGAGGLLVQDDAGAGSWVVTLVALAVLSPVHARLVFGRPGPRGGWLLRRRPPRRKGDP